MDFKAGHREEIYRREKLEAGKDANACVLVFVVDSSDDVAKCFRPVPSDERFPLLHLVEWTQI